MGPQFHDASSTFCAVRSASYTLAIYSAMNLPEEELDTEFLSWLLYSADSLLMESLGSENTMNSSLSTANVDHTAAATPLSPAEINISKDEFDFKSDASEMDRLLHEDDEEDDEDEEEEVENSSHRKRFPSSSSGTSLKDELHHRKKRQRDDALEIRLAELKTGVPISSSSPLYPYSLFSSFFLYTENQELTDHVRNVTQRTKETQKQRIEMERQMTSILNEINTSNGDVEADDTSDLAEILKNYRELYADYGTVSLLYLYILYNLDLNGFRRLPIERSKVSFKRTREADSSHFHHQKYPFFILFFFFFFCAFSSSSLSSCVTGLNLSLVFVVFLYTLQQECAFQSIRQSPLINILTNELHITEEQWTRVQKRRESIRQLLLKMRESLNLIHELDSLITAKHSTFDAECGKIEKACTVEQKVKFLLWIKSNADTLQQVKKVIYITSIRL